MTMFQPLTLDEVALSIAARAHDPISGRKYVRGVTQNSTGVTPNSLFFALKGRRVDGHNFVRPAAEAGAIAAVVERIVDAPIPQLLVPSTMAAMGDLARYYRMKLNLPLVAVTGSVAKTSTKDMVGDVLSARYNTHRSRKNYNNELGVPLELFQLREDHEISVLELAMRGTGQIRDLGRIARPNVAIITNIGISHIEQLGSRKNIASAKAEVIDCLDSEGLAVLNRDDDFYNFLMDVANANGCKTVSFGYHAEADFRITNVRTNERGNPSFAINGVPIVLMNSAGRHHAINAAASFAVGNHYRIKAEEIAEKLSTYRTPEGRGQISFAKCGAIILNSSYNAAPDSVKATLDALADLKGKGRRSIAVLGDMLELGVHGEKAHKYIGDYVRSLGVDILITVGVESKFIGMQAAMPEWEHFSKSEEAVAFLLNECTSSDVIAIQGSRALFLDQIATALERGTLMPTASDVSGGTDRDSETIV